MKQKYLSPKAKITLWDNEVFLKTSAEEQTDNIFGWDWVE